MGAAGLTDDGLQFVESVRADTGELVVARLFGVVKQVGFDLGAAKQTAIDAVGFGVHKLTKRKWYGF